MTYIDSAMLDLTEWFCRKFQLLTGRTNVWLAVQLTNLSIVVYFVWAGVYFWSNGVAARMALGLFCSGLLYVLTQTVFKVPIEAYENDAFRRVARGFRNPRRVRDARLRISFLTLCFVLLYPVLLVSITLRVHIALLSYSLIVLTTVVLYLLACDPLPPCAGTLRAWLRGSARSRLAVSESSGGSTTSLQFLYQLSKLRVMRARVTAGVEDIVASTKGASKGMPTKKKTRRTNVPHVVIAAAVHPVTRRLSRIEDLLIEMRGEQDRHLKRIAALQRQLDGLSAVVEEQLSKASAAS